MKIAPTLAALALVASACASTSSDPQTPGGQATATGEQTNGGSVGSPAQSPTRPGGGSTQPGGPRTATSAPAASYADDAGVGAMARAYLQPSPATKMIVEIDYMQGREPRDTAVSHLKDVLERNLGKPGGITVEVNDSIPEERSNYSIEDIVQLERRYRDHRSSGSTATMWIVYLNDGLAGEEGTLGVAYKASAAAIFPDQIDSAATALVQAGAIERSVLTHEAGHLLGLVNLVARSAYDHEDPEHRYHSKYKESVMYWAIVDVSISSLLSGGPPDDFDRYDEADLAALRSG